MKTGLAEQPDVLDSYRDVHASLRADIQVSRHLYQGEPAYLAHDPVSFRTHRFSLRDYEVLTTLNQDRPLRDVFRELLDCGRLNEEEERDFYEFVVKLHRLGLLASPIHDGGELYRRHAAMHAANVRGRAFRFLFLQIPLANPDQFLSRTVEYVRWMFTVQFFAAWVIAGVSALFVVFSRLDEFAEPLNGILAAQNLPFLWLALVGLKIWHELGHGYACKVFGGRVPEMGTLLIAGTPAAYVDASAAWSFERKRHRLIVMCGGMFFESLVAIPAVFIWAMSPHSFLGSCAFQLVFMASVITLLFNANPLMRFDGYFIASELLGMHNLRPRANAEVKGWLKRIFLGIRPTPSSSNLRVRTILLVYGIAAAIYKQMIILSIAVSIASKFLVIGLLLAAYHVLTTVASASHLLWKYLLTSNETEPIRGRARWCAMGVFVGLPLVVLIVPTPFAVSSAGVVGAQHEFTVRAESPGVLRNVMARANDELVTGDAIAHLVNREIESALMVSQAALARAQTEYYVVRDRQRSDSAKLQRSIVEFEDAVVEQQRLYNSLAVTAPVEGRVVNVMKDSHVGHFIQKGDAIATVVQGQTTIRTWLNADQLRSIRAAVGSPVRCRFPGQSTSELAGRVQSVKPAAIAVMDELAVTQVAGGDILVDRLTGEPIEALFEVQIVMPEQLADGLQHGTRASLRFKRRYESLGVWMCRRCMTFVNKMLLS